MLRIPLRSHQPPVWGLTDGFLVRESTLTQNQQVRCCCHLLPVSLQRLSFGRRDSPFWHLSNDLTDAVLGWINESNPQLSTAWVQRLMQLTSLARELKKSENSSKCTQKHMLPTCYLQPDMGCMSSSCRPVPCWASLLWTLSTKLSSSMALTIEAIPWTTAATLWLQRLCAWKIE